MNLVRKHAMTAAASLMLWTTGSFAAEDADWLVQIEAQENLLTELQSTRGPTDLALVEPIQAMISLLRERSEYVRIAELQDRQLVLMRTNLGPGSPELISLLQDIVVNRIALGENREVFDFLEQLRNLSAVEDDPESLLRMIDAQAHWYVSGAGGRTHDQRVDNFFDARDLIKELESLLSENFDEHDPATIPWLYRVALNKYQMVGLLNSRDSVSAQAVQELEMHDGDAWLSPTRGVIRASKTSRGQTGEWYLREAIGLFEDIGDILSATGDFEAQAMAKIYEADFQLLSNWASAFRMYSEARDLLREAGVSDEQISRYFSRPQLLPVDRFYPTLEEAIARQDADLASWRPDQPDVAHVARFKAWNESGLRVREPTSDHAFWNIESSYFQAELEFNISSVGAVSAVEILDFVPDDDRGIRPDIRRAVEKLHFRPIMEDNRRRRLHDVRMQYLVPQGN